MLEAVTELDLPRSKALLKARPDLLGVRDRQERNLLQLACWIPPLKRKVTPAAQTRMCEFLLDQGFSIDEPVGKDACTALFFAVAGARNPSLVKLLLNRGADVNTAPGGGLFAAGWWNDVDNLKLLIDAGAEIDIVVGITPFLASWCWKQFNAAKYLAQRGADVNYQDQKGRTALHHGVEKEFDPRLLAWLVRHGASPDLTDRDGISARLKASRKRDKRWFTALS
jgi:ankyrin repeat protein